MIIFATTLIFVSLAEGESDPRLLHPLSDEFIHYINNAQNSWTAGRNFHPNMSMDYLKKIQGVIKVDHQWPKKGHLEEDITELPEYFDAREKWSYCKSLNEIRDQGNCGNSWAMAPAAIVTDYFCIQSEGKVDFHVSAIDLTTCNIFATNGCDGGYMSDAFSYMSAVGAVSGGNYNSKTGCKPYPFQNCNHHKVISNNLPDCNDVHEKYKKCEKKCITKEIDYFNKTTIEEFLAVRPFEMRQSIYENGPLLVVFDVYADFLSYKKGVYEHTVGELLGSQAVRIIGWGVENGVKYWLAANSWNENWGDKGFFKIRRGINHCDIEGFGEYPVIKSQP